MKKIFFLLSVFFCLYANAQSNNNPQSTASRIRPQAPTSLSYPSPNTFTAGTAIATLSPTFTGGTPSSYFVWPSLPSGLSISSSTGKITGKPTTAKSQATYTVTAYNLGGSKSFGVVIKVIAAGTSVQAPVSLSYTTPNVFTTGAAISTLTPTVTGGAPTTYSVSPTLPSGLAISTTTGQISGTPSAAKAVTTYTVTGSNSAGSKSFGVVITVNAAAPVVQAPASLGYTSPNVFTAGTAISTLTPTVSGGAPTSYSVSPSLPSGLAISASTGKITGTPSAASSSATYTVTASNSAGSKSFGVVITVNAAAPVVQAPASLSYTSPNVFTAGTAISTLTPTVTGGAPTSYSISPALPPGLAISASTGKITGTPSATSSSATYTVTASNSAGSKSFGVVITVNAAAPVVQAPASLSYTSPNVFTAGTAISTLSPAVTGGAPTSYSVSPALPSGLAISASTGVISGTPSAAKTLATYTVTASNSAGSKSFGVVITVNAAPVNPAPGPTASVNYTSSTGSISNPERGFYKHTETHSSSYSALDQSSLTSYRTSSNITLILRVFYLEDFVNSNISSAYLSNMQSDFAKIRAAGLKCIVRFAYADHNDPGVPHDASKTMVLSHINQLKPILQSNQDIIALMQAGFVGSWGEWYYTDNFGMSPTATDYANRKAVLDALLAVLPNRMAQIRTPNLKQNTYNTTAALTAAQAYNGTSIARVGHHNDCFLASSDDYGTYNNLATEYPYLEQETKYLPMGGETCAVNAPRSQCGTAVSEMAKFHWSFMNLDYNGSVISGFQSGGCFTEMQNRLGYRFELVNGNYPTSAGTGASVAVSMQIKNSGFATPYNARTAYIVFRNTGTNAEYRVALSANPRLWNAGTTVTVSENVTLPAAMPQGTYKLFLTLPDADAALSTRPEYSIRLANNNIWEATTGYNDLQHTINVTSQTGRVSADAANNATALTVYPVPANSTLTMEMSNITKYELAVYNTLGQKMPVQASVESEDKMTLNTQNLATGIYFVSFDNGTTKETKRIMVSH